MPFALQIFYKLERKNKQNVNYECTIVMVHNTYRQIPYPKKFLQKLCCTLIYQRMCESMMKFTSLLLTKKKDKHSPFF